MKLLTKIRLLTQRFDKNRREGRGYFFCHNVLVLAGQINKKPSTVFCCDILCTQSSTEMSARLSTSTQRGKCSEIKIETENVVKHKKSRLVLFGKISSSGGRGRGHKTKTLAFLQNISTQKKQLRKSIFWKNLVHLPPLFMDVVSRTIKSDLPITIEVDREITRPARRERDSLNHA